jgi:hypothetical protein
METPRYNLQDRSNEMEMRLTLEDSNAYEINLVVGVDDRPGAAIRQHFRTRSRVRCR